jgi:1,4-alpha-glucan branching enzyme
VDAIHKYILDYYEKSNQSGFLLAPFDTELFGHWWYEGIRWIGKVLRKISQSDIVQVQDCKKFLESNPPEEIISIPEGSWGQGGHHYIWLNKDTIWTWKLIYRAEDDMRKLVDKYENTKDSVMIRILKQMARELLLMESSDWQFLISTWSARDYAEERVQIHYNNFQTLSRLIHDLPGLWDSEKERILQKIESIDRIFPDIDFRNWHLKNKE